MPIPEFDLRMVADGNYGVLLALQEAQRKMSDPILAFFLEVVPERGTDLWECFRTYQEQEPEGLFCDFIVHVIELNKLKLFFPKGCLQDNDIQEIFARRIRIAVEDSIQTDEDGLNIYFAEGTQYETARKVVCSGCNLSECNHWQKRPRR